MSFNKPIRRVGIVGTGVIGASWAAQYLASEDSMLSDYDPGAGMPEANLPQIRR